MKGKISSMWRVVIALALVLSFSLVTAVPAMATTVTQPIVTVSPNTTLLVGKYTINFNVTTTLAAASGTIDIDFTDWGGATYVPAYGDWEIGDVTINGAYVVTFADPAGSANDIRFTTPVDIAASGSVEIIIETTASVKNPTVGSKTITVDTSADDTARTSKAFIICGYTGKPASLYTNKGEFVNSYYEIEDAIDGAGSETYWTVEVSSEYNSATGPETFPIDIDVEGLTVKSVDGAASTIIEGSSVNGAGIINMAAANVTLGGPDSGFTIKGITTTTTYAAVLFTTASSNVCVQGNILTGNLGSHAIKDLTGEAGAGIVMTIKDNIMSSTVAAADNDAACTWLCPKGGSLIDNNEASGFLVGMSTYGPYTDHAGSWTNPIIISNNKSYGHYYEGMCADGYYQNTNQYDYIIFSGNECYDNKGNGINISTDTDYVIVTGNSLYNNEGMGLKVHANYQDTDNVWVWGNNIYGNESTVGDATTDDFGILNYGYATGTVTATHNWWGDATGPSSGTGFYASTATGSGDAVSSYATYNPWLGASISAADYRIDTTVSQSLNRQSTVGVDVNNTDSTATSKLGVAHYTANPQGTTEFTALDFFDVYAYAGTWTDDLVTIKLYNDGVTSSSKAYFWSEAQGAWVECYDQGVGSGFVWVKVRPYSAVYPERVPVVTDLVGLPFAISSEEAPVTTKGDFDSDGDIDLADFVEFAAAYGSSTGDANYNVIGDFDDSGDIGLADFVEFAAVYGS